MMVSLFDHTTAMCLPWAQAGHVCVAVDIQHDGVSAERIPGNDTDDGWIVTVGADIHDVTLDHLRGWGQDDDLTFLAAFPPCTDLAVSGARWFKAKGLTALIEALQLVDAARILGETAGAPWFLENPVSTISSYWRKPDHIFHPWQYGGYLGGEDDGYTKKTCLWTGGGFVMPDPKPIDLDQASHNRIHHASPGPERANVRSATPRGFAQAVWQANDPFARQDTP